MAKRIYRLDETDMVSEGDTCCAITYLEEDETLPYTLELSTLPGGEDLVMVAFSSKEEAREVGNILFNLLIYSPFATPKSLVSSFGLRFETA